MKSIFEPEARRELIERLGRLSPEASARWGRLDAPRMVAHLIESARMATGDLPVAPRQMPLRIFPLNYLVVYSRPSRRARPRRPSCSRARPRPGPRMSRRCSG